MATKRRDRLTLELADARAQLAAVRCERDDVLDALAEATAGVRDAAAQMTTLNRTAQTLRS